MRSGKSHKYWARRVRHSRGTRSPPGGSRNADHEVLEHGPAAFRSQAHSQVLRQDPRSRGDAEPHRGAEVELRPVPAVGRRTGAARRRGAEGDVPVGLSDQGLQRDRGARVRQVRARAAEVRRRRVHAARHDLCRAAEGHAAPDRLRGRRGDRRPLGQGHQGAGRLHGRHAADDAERHLHRQRHRARHRLADAPLARRLLRPRPGQDPLVGQAALHQPRDPLPRLLARLRVRRQGHRLRPHRPPPEAAGDDAALCARHGPGRHHGGLLTTP